MAQNIITGTEGRDRLLGTAGDDLINGLGGRDQLWGFGGDDDLHGGFGDDQLRGGEGNDLYFVDTATEKVMERPDQGTDTVVSSISYALGANVERLVLSGTTPTSGTGNRHGNEIIGSEGDNVLDGGLGNDTLIGGFGSDTYLFDTRVGTDNVDIIQGFGSGEDIIALDSRIFLGSDAPGAIEIGTAASGPDVRIAYDPASGALMYDPDGSGADAPVTFAMLDGAVTLSVQDFDVF